MFAEVVLIKELLFAAILVFVQDHAAISTFCIAALDVAHVVLLAVFSPHSQRFIQLFEIVIAGSTALHFVVVFLLAEYQWQWLYWTMVGVTLFVVAASVATVLVRARGALWKVFSWCCCCCRCNRTNNQLSIQ